jgi:hypothetical protein
VGTDVQVLAFYSDLNGTFSGFSCTSIKSLQQAYFSARQNCATKGGASIFRRRVLLFWFSPVLAGTAVAANATAQVDKLARILTLFNYLELGLGRLLDPDCADCSSVCDPNLKILATLSSQRVSPLNLNVAEDTYRQLTTKLARLITRANSR